MGPDIRRVKIQDLTPGEKDKLLEAILDHLGREIEITKWGSEGDRSVDLVKLRSY